MRGLSPVKKWIDSPVGYGIAVVLILLLGVALRCVALGEETAWGDETLTATCFPSADFGTYLESVYKEDSIPRLAPVYFGVQYGWSLFFGGSVLSLRLLSVFLSTVAGVQLFFLVKAIGGSRAGLWATWIYSVSLFEIYYGQEIRFYALMNVFALMALHGTLMYRRGQTRPGVILALVGNAALIGTHSFSVVFVAALGLYMVSLWRESRRLLIWWGCHGVLALLFLVWTFGIAYDVNSNSTAFADQTAGWRELVSTALQLAGGRFSNWSPAPYLPAGGWVDLAIGAVVASLVAVGVVRAMLYQRGLREEDGKKSDVLLLLVALVVPVLLLFLIGKMWRPCFFTRYVVYAALPLYALVGISMAGLSPGWMRRSVALMLIGLFAWQNLALPRPFRADYGALHRAVMADEAPAKVVLALKPFNYQAAVFAMRDTEVPCELLLGLKEIRGISIQRANAGASVWAVFYRWDDFAPFESGIADAGLTLSHFESAGMPPLRIYHITAP